MSAVLTSAAKMAASASVAMEKGIISFIGFPRTLNALGILDEVLQDHGVSLPLPDAATVTDEDRHERGRAIQEPLYGTEIVDTFAPLPEPYGQAVPGFLTDFLFGDLWTREGLDVATREIVGLCALTALGLERQVPLHVRGAIAAGNSREKILAVLVQIFPYIGFPLALNAIRTVLDLED